MQEGQPSVIKPSIQAALCCSILLGLIVGIALSLEPAELSRWQEFQSVRVGMTKDEVLAVVDSSDKSQSGCGTHQGENHETVCRFDDPCEAI